MLIHLFNLVLLKNKVISEIFRFLIAGIISNVVNFLLYRSLYAFGFELFFASLFGYFIGILVSYSFGRKWVFGRKYSSTKKLFLLFFLIYIFGGIGMSTIIVILTNFFGFDYQVSWIFGAFFAFVNNFFGQKFIVFKKGDSNG